MTVGAGKGKYFLLYAFLKGCRTCPNGMAGRTRPVRRVYAKIKEPPETVK